MRRGEASGNARVDPKFHSQRRIPRIGGPLRGHNRIREQQTGQGRPGVRRSGGPQAPDNFVDGPSL